MKLVNCTQCGSAELFHEPEYVVCAFCRSRFLVQPDDYSVRESIIGVLSDVAALLEKCESDPANRLRYTNLILDIDPTNNEVMKYLR